MKVAIVKKIIWADIVAIFFVLSLFISDLNVNLSPGGDVSFFQNWLLLFILLLLLLVLVIAVIVFYFISHSDDILNN